MSVSIFFIYIRIIVDKILVSRIVRRIYINYVYRPFVRITQRSKGFQVISLYKYVIR